jgi:transposase
VKTISVPWAEPGSSFTALMEALIIDWLLAASVSAVADLLGLTWDQVDGVYQRAVVRGLSRRQLVVPSRIGVDETSFQKRHEYVTVVADTQRGIVQHVADGHGEAALVEYYASFSREDLARIESVSMDMWGPYIAATQAAVPAAESKIAFDKFHVAQNLGNAVDQVRRQEHRILKDAGDATLAKTRNLWLTQPDHLKPESREKLDQLTQKALKTSRAWMLKELAMEMWTSRDPEEAREIFSAWYSWAIRSRLEPMKRVARMLMRHLQGVLNAIALGVTNARLEGINNLIQGLKRSARGFRNRDRFRNAIYFHLGGLDLYPDKFSHSKA